MRKYLLLFLLVFIAHVTSAQNNGVIKGRIIDSATNTPVEFVTVAVLTVKDTTSLLLSYTITDKTGAFNLHNLPGGVTLKVFISNVAYRPYRKIVTLSKGEVLDLGDIKPGINQMKEVVIKGERPPVVIRKDTIEFNAEAFKTRPNAVVEDLLKKLPGVEVDMNGKIEVNGKSISKILVDGHEFFSNDYRIATKNLDVDLVDKIQVYDDRENDPDHLIPDSKVDKIINIKFKKALRKSIFGKVYAGAGTQDRYTAGGLFNMFRDTLQVSVLSLGNNLNGTNFSVNDLYQSGGFNRGGAGAFYSGGFSPAGSGFNFSGNSGIQKVISSGININTDYGKKLKINLAYFYSHSHTDNYMLVNTQRLLDDTTLSSESSNSSIQLYNRHNISATVQWRPTDVTQLIYTPSVSFTGNRNNTSGMSSTGSNFTPQISESAGYNNSLGNSLNVQQSLNYNHQFKKKGESINLTHFLSVSNNDNSGYNDYQLTSYTSALSSYLLNRSSDSKGRSINANISTTYRYPFSKKLSGNIGITDIYNHQVNNNITYDFDPVTGQYDSFLQTLSTALTRNQWTEGINPGLTYTFKQNMRLDIAANLQTLQVNNQFGRGLPDLDQHYFTALPNINLNLGGYSVSYQSTITLPNIGDMVPYTVTSSPQYSVTGNPDLKPTRRDNYTFRYFIYNLKRQLSLNAGASAALEQNSIFRHQTLNAVGATTSMPVNMDGRTTFSANGSVSKGFKKTNNFQLHTNTGISGNKSHSYFEINSQGGYQNTLSYSINQQVSLNWKDIIDLDQSYTLNNSVTNYEGINYNSVHYASQALNTHLMLSLPMVATVEGTYAYTYNPVVTPGFQKTSNIVNLSIAHALLNKDRGEIKLSCYDLLNQSISSYRSVSANSISDQQSQVLRRYFLLTLQFKFSKVITK